MSSNHALEMSKRLKVIEVKSKVSAAPPYRTHRQSQYEWVAKLLTAPSVFVHGLLGIGRSMNRENYVFISSITNIIFVVVLEISYQVRVFNILSY